LGTAGEKDEDKRQAVKRARFFIYLSGVIIIAVLLYALVIYLTALEGVPVGPFRGISAYQSALMMKVV
jgi:hypothetical protein